MKLEEEIGKRIQYYRQANGYTQERLAELVAVSAPAISRIETGKLMLGVPTLLQIAEVLGITANTLLYPPEQEKPVSDEWNERIIILLEKYSVEQKEYIWKTMKGFLELQSKKKDTKEDLT